MNKVVRIQEQIQPHFKPVWTSKHPHVVMKGGRTSFKSSTGFPKAVYNLIPYLIKGERANTIVLRKVANTIRTSTFNNVIWALDMFGILEQFKMQHSPPMITHIETGSTFYFYGLDDPMKLKSNKVEDVIQVVWEELAEMNNAEEVDQTNITFLRQKKKGLDHVQVMYMYNPPRNPYNWVNEWTEQKRNDKRYLVHESTYKNDELGFVTEDILAEINAVKENDYDYYRYLYLGEPVGLGTNIYNLSQFNALDELPSDDRLIALYYSIDGGHSRSATTCSLFGLTAKRRVIMLDVYYYSPDGQAHKKAPSDLAKDINEFMVKTQEVYKGLPVRRRTIDSAEGALYNQYAKDYGIYFNKVAKQRKDVMVDFTHVLLAQGRFYYLKKPTQLKMSNVGATDVFVDEVKRYMWDEKTKDSDNPKVVKTDDHIIDGFQYACVDNASEWGIKR